MQQMTTELQQQIKWRKSQVLELSSQGYTEREIASRLQVHCTTVHRDLVYLRHQAQENLQHHIHETIPEEYQKCMMGMKRNLKQTLEIAETSSDPRVKLQARAIANDCYKYIMDLVTNGTIVSDSLNYVNGKAQKLVCTNNVQTEEEVPENLEDKTTNDVF